MKSSKVTAARSLAGLRAAWSSTEATAERFVPWLCLGALAVRFYPSALRFLDIDEIFYLYVSAAVSRGHALYSELHFPYPPVLFYIGALFFKLSGDPFIAILVARLFVLTAGLIGFALVFEIYRKLGLTWFILPAAFFIAFLIQFNFKLMEYRADNLLGPVIVLQTYLLFRLASGCIHPTRILALFLLLAVLSFHINQKAAFVEPAVVLAMVLTQRALCVNVFRKYGAALLVSAAPLLGLLAWSRGYPRFLYHAYVEVAQTDLPVQMSGKLEFLEYSVLQNIGFWVVCLLATYFLVATLPRHRRLVFPSLILLAASCALLYATFFPFHQYQLFVVWAALCALPVGTRLARDEAGIPLPLLWLVSIVAALSSVATVQPASFPYPSLEQSATLVRTVASAVGAEPVAALGGDSLTIESVFPADAANPVGPQDSNIGGRLYNAYVLYHEWTMRDILRGRGTKFIFDPRDRVRTWATSADGQFIGLHYARCRDLPLLISSQWFWVDPSQPKVDVAIAGDYRVRAVSTGSRRLLDGAPVGDGQILRLAEGFHAVDVDSPTALLVEFASPQVTSQTFSDADDAKASALQSIEANFSDSFRLLGLLHLDEGDSDVYRLFWEKTGRVDADLLAFHHFRDAGGRFIHGENVDPGAGWYSLRDLEPGQHFSYSVRVAKSLPARRLEVGLYHKDNIAMRIPCGSETFYAIGLSNS